MRRAALAVLCGAILVAVCRESQAQEPDWYGWIAFCWATVPEADRVQAVVFYHDGARARTLVNPHLATGGRGSIWHTGPPDAELEIALVRRGVEEPRMPGCEAANVDMQTCECLGPVTPPLKLRDYPGPRDMLLELVRRAYDHLDRGVAPARFVSLPLPEIAEAVWQRADLRYDVNVDGFVNVWDLEALRAIAAGEVR